jgi:hypothetical protein
MTPLAKSKKQNGKCNILCKTRKEEGEREKWEEEREVMEL